MSSINTILENLKERYPIRYKLYQLAVWLCHESPSHFPIDDDLDRQINFINELQKIQTADSYMDLLLNYDIFDQHRKSNIYGATLYDIGWGLASRYLNN
jgi:hypothetical protein